MSKRILVLNGSPRPKGNTAALIAEFVQGAEASGHTITRFNLMGMNIRPCLGCIKGGKDPASPCVQKDDMDKIYSAYREADVVVLASPMYYWGFTGLLKVAFDRLFAVAEADNYASPKKDCILIMAAEDDSESNWKPVLDYYHALLGHLEWKNCGTVLAGGVFQLGDIKGHPALEEAKKLGTSI